MKILLSIPSGYHARELLLPLHTLLEADTEITDIIVVTPGAPWQRQLFPDFSNKFTFVVNPQDDAGHTQLLSEHTPDIVITPTVGLDVLDAPILRAAMMNNIPTLTFVSSWDNVFKMERLIHKGHSGLNKNSAAGYVIPDHFAVWNQMNFDHLCALLPDFDPRHITITGAPRFDYFSHTDKIPTKSTLADYLGLHHPDHHLIHAATTELYPFDYIINTIAEARDTKRLAAPINLYASVHPGGDITKHQSYTKHGATVRYSFGRRDTALHPSFVYLPTTEEIYLLVALFKHGAILVNQSSTVAIESALADVPIINVTYGQRFDIWRWRRSMVYRDFKQHYRYITDTNGTTLVKNERQLITSINTYLKHPEHLQTERAAIASRLLTYTDGSASRRLLTAIKSATK